MPEIPILAMSPRFATPVLAKRPAVLGSAAKILHDADGYEAPPRPVDICLLRRLSLAERLAACADFGRTSSPDAAQRSEWELLYRSDATPAAQAAALDAVAPYQTSSVGREAVGDLEAEQALN